MAILLNIRTIKVVRDITDIILPKLIKDCIELPVEDEAIYLWDLIYKYNVDLLHAMERHCLFVDDVSNIHKWFHLSTDFIEREPYQHKTFIAFWRVYTHVDNGMTIMESLINNICHFKTVKDGKYVLQD